MFENYKILVLDDDKDNLAAFRFNFGRKFNLVTESDPLHALELLAREPCEVLVVDQRMPGMDGMTFISRARDLVPRAPAILLTAFADFEVVIEALNSGLVYRYLQKPWDRTELEATLRQALEHYRLEDENRNLVARLEQLSRYLGKEVEERSLFGDMVGNSASLVQVMNSVQGVAPTNSSVLITGESGTGKEVAARAIHNQSPRQSKPFIRVNCGALAPGVIESELFGHEKGAFTGAVGRKLGRFELAHQGTLFLDEIGDLSLELQVKLLRVLQEREFERVGGSRTIRVDLRIIAATHQDLEELVREGRFREDLYYRIAVFPIHMPPLRERKEDIPLLARHFLNRHRLGTGLGVADFTQEALDLLMAHSWPGNIRELENAVERAMIVARESWIRGEDLRFLEGKLPAGRKTSDEKLSLSALLESVEEGEIRAALERCEGSVARTAEELGIKRTALYYKLKKYGLDYDS